MNLTIIFGREENIIFLVWNLLLTKMKVFNNDKSRCSRYKKKKKKNLLISYDASVSALTIYLLNQIGLRLILTLRNFRLAHASPAPVT